MGLSEKPQRVMVVVLDVREMWATGLPGLRGAARLGLGRDASVVTGALQPLVYTEYAGDTGGRVKQPG